MEERKQQEFCTDGAIEFNKIKLSELANKQEALKATNIAVGIPTQEVKDAAKAKLPSKPKFIKQDYSGASIEFSFKNTRVILTGTKNDINWTLKELRLNLNEGKDEC